jgi:hypothetical protein
MNDYIYDQRGNAVGYVRGRYIHEMSGRAVGQLAASHNPTLWKVSPGLVAKLGFAGASACGRPDSIDLDAARDNFITSLRRSWMTGTPTGKAEVSRLARPRSRKRPAC